jgi:hypothetical protein
MSDDFYIVFSGICTWFGGVASWLFAWLYDYIPKYFRYESKIKDIRTSTQRDPAYAKLIGNIELYVQDSLRVPRPLLWASCFYNAVPSLLVLAIVVVGVFMFCVNAPVGRVVSWGLMIVVILLSFIHESGGKERWVNSKFYRTVIIVLWSLYLILILHLTAAFSAVTAAASQTRGPLTPPPPTPQSAPYPSSNSLPSPARK